MRLLIQSISSINQQFHYFDIKIEHTISHDINKTYLYEFVIFLAILRFSFLSNPDICEGFDVVYDIMSEKCDGFESCSVTVNSDELGGDPCPNNYKYLNVTHECYCKEGIEVLSKFN